MALIHLETAISSGEVDKVNGIIRGVAVITNGISARGHNLEVDDTTLEQIHECATKMGQVSVKTNHKTGADAVNGYLKNFRMNDDKSKLLADWHLLKTYEGRNHILEIAEVMPRNVGLSAAFIGKEEVKGGKKYARCSELMAVDFVAQPAANPDGLGLEAKHFFEAIQFSQVDSQTKSMPSATEPTLADVMNKLTELSTKQTEQDAIISRLVEFAEGDPGEGGAPVYQDPENGRAYVIDETGAAQEVEIEGEGAPEGVDPNAGEGEGEGEGAPAGEAALSRNAQTAVELAVKKTIGGIRREEAKEQAFNAVEQKIVALGDAIAERDSYITQLEAENEAMRLAISQGNAQNISFSAEGDLIVNGRGQNLTEFEQAVEEKKAAGMKATDAISAAVRENPVRFSRHQAQKGMITMSR
jgi:hypothetical protein